MKKIISLAIALLALPLLVNAEVASTTLLLPQPQTTAEEVFTLCKQTTIEKRDTATVAARSTYTTAINTALTIRKEREKVAVALTDKKAKKSALKKIVADYKTAVIQAQTTLTTTRKAILTTSETESKMCQKSLKDAKKIEDKKKVEVLQKSSEQKIESAVSERKNESKQGKLWKSRDN